MRGDETFNLSMHIVLMGVRRALDTSYDGDCKKVTVRSMSRKCFMKQQHGGRTRMDQSPLATYQLLLWFFHSSIISPSASHLISPASFLLKAKEIMHRTPKEKLKHRHKAGSRVQTNKLRKDGCARRGKSAVRNSTFPQETTKENNMLQGFL